METNSWQSQNLTIKEELEIISKNSNWCECCHEYILKSETSKHFKSYENYRGLLKERFHKGKPNGFTCKICSVIYLKKWAMFKHFFSNHPIETIETALHPIQIEANCEKPIETISKLDRNTKSKKREVKKAKKTSFKSY